MNIGTGTDFQLRTHCVVLSALVLAFFAGSTVMAKAKIVKVKTAADSEKAGYESFRAMDGDPSTMWHT